MTAQFIHVGEPAHDPERQAIRYLVEGLPDDHIVYGNPWLVEASGAIFEVDAVVVSPHAIYVVEVKTYRGRIEGNDLDWYIPYPIRSPLGLNRKTAQVLSTLLKRENFNAGHVWVEGFVFLSATQEVDIEGPASRDRVHTRRTILGALQDVPLIKRLSRRAHLTPTGQAAAAELHRLLMNPRIRVRPTRHIREYEILDTLDRREGYVEFLGRHGLSSDERILRVYTLDGLASDDERARVEKRARWEAQVLSRLGRCHFILKADQPFMDEAGFVLPLENFRGVSLVTWLDKYGPALSQRRHQANLLARVDLWLKIVEGIQDAHEQGVVHRLLRPEAILVEDKPDDPDIRITGFDLAKQASSQTTLSISAISDERLRFAAPEVVQAFSSAEPASDQFSLGALLGLILAGKPLFNSTRELMAQRRLITRVRDFYPRVPLTLDEAVAKMLALRPTERFPSLLDAAAKVREVRGQDRVHVQAAIELQAALDPENLAPGTRIEPDYLIKEKLGEGGMAVVYAAQHLISGRLRALKVARANSDAEDALFGEFDILHKLDHPNIVQVIDVTNIVPGRRTLIMERVGGTTLRRWLADPAHAAQHGSTLRRFAENLLAALEYLEQRGIIHKDLKPENLLVGENGLIMIDFSLASIPEDATYCGTALYRDPAGGKWTHATDRYAAALCLFELYTGRHAFDGQVPEPGSLPNVREEDIDPPGLAAFFLKALHPNPEQRFPSARQMRDGFLTALGESVLPEQDVHVSSVVDASTDLHRTSLSRRAVNQLRRVGVTTAGELLALSPDQVRAIHAIGTKTAQELIDFQEQLRSQGIQPVAARQRPTEPLLAEHMANSPEPIEALPLPASVRAALRDAGLTTVGALASTTRSELLNMPGMGRKRVGQIMEGLQRFGSRAGGVITPSSTDHLWDAATRPLSDPERQMLDQVVGVLQPPRPQVQLAKELGTDQPKISKLFRAALDHLDRAPLTDALIALDSLLDNMGGVALLTEVAERLEEHWPAETIPSAGIVRLLVQVAGDRFHFIDSDMVEIPILARPRFDKGTVRAFAEQAHRVAAQWPPVEAESARRTLAAVLPEYDGNPVQLAVRLLPDLRLMEGGELFIPPLEPWQSLDWVLKRERLPILFDTLAKRVDEIFSDGAPLPEREHLVELLGQLHYQVVGEEVFSGEHRSVFAQKSPGFDPLPVAIGPELPYEDQLREQLCMAAKTRGFRMLVTPPEHHAEIGPSVAAALNGTWLSFEELWFQRHEHELAKMERRERFQAQRRALTTSSEALVQDLLDEHGQPGRTLVLGDTALLQRFDALDLIRRLYDDTMSGERGFWVLVIPGIIHRRQPLFNESVVVWHLEGITVPLLKPMKPAALSLERT